ncbi:MAG: discoidin domain-containing protein, partial [Paludibacteraceae bacterium]|nr:discoidin domain-containing protein [Paludibacteraceae bacterium]
MSVGMWADPTIYSGFTVTASSEGLENHGAANLVDGKFSAGTEGTDWTKWSAEKSMRSNPSGGPGLFWWVDFRSDEPIAITGYILTSSNQIGQTPTTWTLDAKLNEGDSWTTITGVLENNTLGANALTDVSFDLDNPGTYKYFRFKVSMVDDPWVNGMQLSELRFTGADGGGSTPEPDPEPSDYSIALDDASIADKVTLSANESEAGQTVTVTPVDGYEITSLTVSYLTNNYSVRVKEEYYGDIEDVDPQVVTLPREFTVYPETGDDGTYTYNDISGGDDKVEYVSGTDNTLTFRVTGAFDGIASIEYEYYTQECYWDDELGEDFCWDQTSIQDIQVACSQIGGNAAVSENAGVYSFTMPAGNVTITAMVEAIAAPEPENTDVNITPNADPDNAGVYYSTFFDSQNSYLLPAGVEAYIATISGNDLLMNKIAVAGQTIPADNAVILKSTVNPFTLPVSDATPVTFSDANSLQGTDVAIATPANCYVLSGKNGVGF